MKSRLFYPEFSNWLSVRFPFLVMLVSGGHSLIALAKDIDDFMLLGKSLDISPGDCLDKVSYDFPK